MKKIFFRIFIFSLISVVIIAGLIIFAISQIVSENINETEKTALNYAAWFSVNKKLNNEMNFITKGKGLNKQRTVILSKAEMNSLLYMSVTAKNTYVDQEKENYKIESIVFDGEKFLADIAVKLKYNTPFGRIVNLHAVIIPGIYDDDLEIEISSLKIGDISIPSSFVNYLLASSKGQLKKNKTVQILLTSINLLKIENDSLVIKYIPANMLSLLSRGTLNS
jgi:hypothetical protein